MKMKFFLFAIMSGCACCVNALTLNQARQLYLDGEYAKALPTFLEYVKRSPRNANYNQWAGACLYETGRTEEAVKYLEFANSKNIAEAARYLAQIALDNMDYSKAKELIDEYNERIDNDESKISEQAVINKHRVERATAMLNNVEKIQIIDSLIVDKNSFFEYYKIAPEAGTINTVDVLPYDKPTDTTTVFIPEFKNRMLWAMPDSTGLLRLTETYKLNSGKWDKYTYLPEVLNDNGNANYPFMMADGTTLYYACDGENSIGGYDIYMSRKDLSNPGEYLQPQNIGMPYNSPYDDYLLVIDEMTGAGWWATDRNRIPGKITIYIFIPNSIRENYDPENDNISSLAAIKSIRDTWTEDTDYNELIDNINSISDTEETMEKDFIFNITNDVIYTSYSDFNSPEAKSMMEKHVEIEKFLDKIRLQLTTLRGKFHKSKLSERPKLSTEILTLERTIEKNTEELKRIDNDIRAAELPTINKR